MFTTFMVSQFHFFSVLYSIGFSFCDQQACSHQIRSGTVQRRVQTPRKLLGFYRTEDRFWPDFANIKHDYTPEFYRSYSSFISQCRRTGKFRGFCALQSGKICLKGIKLHSHRCQNIFCPPDCLNSRIGFCSQFAAAPNAAVASQPGELTHVRAHLHLHYPSPCPSPCQSFVYSTSEARIQGHQRPCPYW